MPKRYWSDYGPNLLAESNKFGGILTMVGGATAGGGAILGAPILLPAIGAAAFVAGAGMCLYRAIPETTETAHDYVGKGAVELTVLRNLRETVPTVGIVGIEDAGKTTLIRKLHHEEEKPEDTTRVQAYVLETINSKTPFALLDGAGEFWAQQMAVAARANILIFLFDHNPSEDDTRLQPERLENHLEAAKQTAQQIKEAGNTKAAIVYRNKFDKWERSTNASKMSEYSLLITELISPHVSRIEHRDHSNLSANDMIKAKNEIENLVAEFSREAKQ